VFGSGRARKLDLVLTLRIGGKHTRTAGPLVAAAVGGWAGPTAAASDVRWAGLYQRYPFLAQARRPPAGEVVVTSSLNEATLIICARAAGCGCWPDASTSTEGNATFFPAPVEFGHPCPGARGPGRFPARRILRLAVLQPVAGRAHDRCDSLLGFEPMIGGSHLRLSQ
jgi:hypothetical protein